jgi:nucleoside-diphosphate-sugar epimerase
MDSLDNLSDKVVVVTGARGYIGSALVDALVKHSCKVIRVSRGDIAPLVNTRTIKADVSTANSWFEIVANADIIYHLAGNTSVYKAAKSPDESLKSTLLPINHLIKAAQILKKMPRVVFASTATVYGLTPQRAIAESIRPNPITVYDLHKLFAEQQLSFASQQGILESVSLRLSNVYGPSSSDSLSDDRGILNRVTSMALRSNDLTVYGDGNYLRDYVYIDDVIRAFLMVGYRKKIDAEVLNVSSGKSISVVEAFKIVAKRAAIVTGDNVKIKYSTWPDEVSEIEFRNYISDVSNIYAKIGWRATISLEAGVDCLIDYIRDRIKSD